MHTNFIRARRLLASGIAAALATATLATAASSAVAAGTPRCNGWSRLTYHDDNGDAGIRSRYPSAGAFDYIVWVPTYTGTGGNPTTSCHLAPGSRADAVEQLQTLNVCYSASKSFRDFLGRVNLGFAFLTVDGVYGAKTQAAVAAVQRHHKIKLDGSYGPQTALAMKHSAKPFDGPYRNNYCHTVFP